MIDLDALEREQEIIAKYPWWSEPETPRSDPSKVLALIAELRASRKVVAALREWARIPNGILHGGDAFWAGVSKLRATLAELEALK